MQARGSLDGYRKPPLGRPGAVPGSGPASDFGPRPAPDAGRPPFLVLDTGRRVVSGDPAHPIGTRVAAGAGLLPVQLNGRTVAYLLASGRPPDPDARSADFLRRTGRAVALVMLAAALVALLVGVLISRALLGPLRVLLAAIRALQGGDRTAPLPSGRDDELGELLGAFGRMRDELTRQQRARRQLTADIAHDLNTPLAVLSGSLEGLVDGTFKPSPERFARLLRQAAQLSGLVRDLRFLASADAGELPLHRRPLDLRELLGEVALGFQALGARQGVTLSARLPPGPLTAEVDPGRLTQVLQNLLGNAFQHTPAGGHIELTGAEAGAQVALVVRDSGVGIPPEQLPHVLDRLYRGDEARSGDHSGLGLAICKSIVEAHGGTITVESAPGEGTRVEVRLPRAAGPAG